MNNCQHLWHCEETTGTCKYCGETQPMLDYRGLDDAIESRLKHHKLRGAERSALTRALDIRTGVIL